MDLIAHVQRATRDRVTVAYVEQGQTRPRAAADAGRLGVQLEVVKPPEVNPGFVLLPRRLMAERSLGWMPRFRRLARDYERSLTAIARLHFLAFAIRDASSGRSPLLHPPGI